MDFEKIRQQEVLDVRQSMTILDHRAYDYYVFRTRSLIGKAGYERWREGIK